LEILSEVQGPVTTMFNSLYTNNVKTCEQKLITFPGSDEMNMNSQVIDSNWLGCEKRKRRPW